MGVRDGRNYNCPKTIFWVQKTFFCVVVVIVIIVVVLVVKKLFCLGQ